MDFLITIISIAVIFYFGFYIFKGRKKETESKKYNKTKKRDKLPYKKTKKRDKLPYKKKDYLFTVAEKEFLSILEPVAKKYNLHAFGKVRMEDLFWLPKMNRSDWMHFRGKVRSRHIDFVLCDESNNYEPVLGIELNDSSHGSKKRKKVDRFKEKVFKDADFPFLKIKYSKNYNSKELEKKIISKIKTNEN